MVNTVLKGFEGGTGATKPFKLKLSNLTSIFQPFTRQDVFSSAFQFQFPTLRFRKKRNLLTLPKSEILKCINYPPCSFMVSYTRVLNVKVKQNQTLLIAFSKKKTNSCLSLQFFFLFVEPLKTPTALFSKSERKSSSICRRRFKSSVIEKFN